MEECELLSRFHPSWNAMVWTWGFKYKGHSVVWGSSCLNVWPLCNRTLSLTSFCRWWICSAWVWPWFVACVLWAYSATHWARPIHLDSCNLAWRVLVSHDSAVFYGYKCGEWWLQRDLNDVEISDQLLSGIGRAFPTRHGLSLHASRLVGLQAGSSKAVVISVPSFQHRYVTTQSCLCSLYVKVVMPGICDV